MPARVPWHTLPEQAATQLVVVRRASAQAKSCRCYQCSIDGDDCLSCGVMSRGKNRMYVRAHLCVDKPVLVPVDVAEAPALEVLCLEDLLPGAARRGLVGGLCV